MAVARTVGMRPSWLDSPSALGADQPHLHAAGAGQLPSARLAGEVYRGRPPVSNTALHAPCTTVRAVLAGSELHRCGPVVIVVVDSALLVHQLGRFYPGRGPLLPRG